MNMVEKIARAIAGHFGHEFDDLPANNAESINRNRVGEMFDSSKEDVLEAAKAALQALREPTDEMVLDAIRATDGEVNAGTIDAIWQAMIDADLNETE